MHATLLKPLSTRVPGNPRSKPVSTSRLWGSGWLAADKGGCTCLFPGGISGPHQVTLVESGFECPKTSDQDTGWYGDRAANQTYRCTICRHVAYLTPPVEICQGVTESKVNQHSRLCDSPLFVVNVGEIECFPADVTGKKFGRS